MKEREREKFRGGFRVRIGADISNHIPVSTPILGYRGKPESEPKSRQCDFSPSKLG